MTRYQVKLNYDASITIEVMANDEGDALDKARNIAEETDPRQFTICNERESRTTALD